MGFEALSAVRRPPIPPDPAPFVTPWTGHAEMEGPRQGPHRVFEYTQKGKAREALSPHL